MPVLNCGVSTHAPECLCDVTLTETVAIKRDLSLADYAGGLDMVEWLGYSTVDVSGDALLDVFDHLARRRDALMALDDPNGEYLMSLGEREPTEAERARFGGISPATNLSKTTKGAAAFIRKMAPSSMSNGELRAETNRIFGTKLKPDHLNHMRKRYAAEGPL